ncbi:hypothetical protein [Pleomorphovibrio marinus]|uniref:hypothetical protein n=1 Tax=Pleomorphovibrio marinus TaxID=2164132 RepID=UPI000E0B0FDA|nr:hypothetical protein [Pleomorphovibrio marinus]
MRKTKRNWLLYSISGLVLIGFGLSVFGEALILKYEEADFLAWFGLGTLSLIIINAGISLFGQGVVCRVKME